MTVKDLIQKYPFVDVKVRDISKDYAYIQDIESVAQMEVESCYTSEATNGMRPVLYANVRGDNIEVKGDNTDTSKTWNETYQKLIVDLKKDVKNLNDRIQQLVEFNAIKNISFNYALTLIQDLLDNSDEYARQRAIDFLKGEKIEDETKDKFEEWIKENGGTSVVLYQTFSDDELEHIFMSAYAKNKR
jgi:hypothetical protein